MQRSPERLAGRSVSQLPEIWELGATLGNGSSALFVLVRKATPDKVLEGLKQFKGKVLKTFLTADGEAKLRDVLEKT